MVPPRTAAVGASDCRIRVMGVGWNGRSFSLTPWRASRRASRVVKAFGAFTHDAPADETFERAQGAVIFGRHEADGVADRVGAACAANTMDLVLRVHREVIMHHVRDAVHIDPASGDVCGDQYAHGAGLEIFQGAQALVLGAI